MRRTKRSFLSILVLAAFVLAAIPALPLSAQTDSRMPAGRESAGSPNLVQSPATDAAQTQRKPEDKADATFVKTYELKHITASEFMQSARFYVLDSSGTENTLTVRIWGPQIPAFEALLKKLDVEKKNIQFRIYAIAASQSDSPSIMKTYNLEETKEISDKSLSKVLDEMKGLWNFRHFWISSPSFLLAKDGSGSNFSRLVSPYSLDLHLLHVRLRGSETGQRMISVGQIQLKQAGPELNSAAQTLINTTDVTLKENGYLVVGVGGLGFPWQAMALILVINAEIK